MKQRPVEPLSDEEQKLLRKLLRTVRVTVWRDSTVFTGWYAADGKPF